MCLMNDQHVDLETSLKLIYQQSDKLLCDHNRELTDLIQTLYSQQQHMKQDHEKQKERVSSIQQEFQTQLDEMRKTHTDNETALQKLHNDLRESTTEKHKETLQKLIDVAPLPPPPVAPPPPPPPEEDDIPPPPPPTSSSPQFEVYSNYVNGTDNNLNNSNNNSNNSNNYNNSNHSSSENVWETTPVIFDDITGGSRGLVPLARPKVPTRVGSGATLPTSNSTGNLIYQNSVTPKLNEIQSSSTSDLSSNSATNRPIPPVRTPSVTNARPSSIFMPAVPAGRGSPNSRARGMPLNQTPRS
eukprot:TRINITY_DN1616_c0_g1_i1.p1 TRINITY_DN1616_c0_g1~~TRINITY_DN1616_c0_g1_i1.p1  ORF type:complete len:338 (+),score=200.91 TRINITY_DN1616_c0_g1_i1:116-1015(+)